MVSALFVERAHQLVRALHPEWERAIAREFLAAREKANARGMLHSSILVDELSQISQRHIEQRIREIWDSVQRVLQGQRVAYSETLAQDLKALVQNCIPTDAWNLLEDEPHLSGNWVEQHRRVLASVRHSAVVKVLTEIDLYVDAMKPRPSNTQASERTVEPNFKILMPKTQGPVDFHLWEQTLEGCDSQIAVFFIDLDEFKALNTKYTETTIDKTILPQAMKLLEKLVRIRGGAYLIGGDEFLAILPNISAEEAVLFGEIIRSSYEQHPFSVNDQAERVTVSVGIALGPMHGATYEDVLQLANNGKREAKQTRNRICLSAGDGTSEKPLPTSGLSRNAQRLAVLLKKESPAALPQDPILDAESLCEKLSMSELELGTAALELSDAGWVTLNKRMGMGKAMFASLSATELLFINTDGTLKGPRWLRPQTHKHKHKQNKQKGVKSLVE